MFKYRAISFPILLALLFYMVWGEAAGGKYVYAVCAALMVGLAVYELGAMTKKIGFKNEPVIAGILGAIPILAFFCLKERFGIGVGILCYLPVLAIFAAWLLLLFAYNQKNKVVDADKGLVEYSPEKTDYLLSVFGSAGVAVILTVPLFFTAITYFIGVHTFLFLALVTKAMDTGGYIFGKLSVVFFGGNIGKISVLRNATAGKERDVGIIVINRLVCLLADKGKAVIQKRTACRYRIDSVFRKF